MTSSQRSVLSQESHEQEELLAKLAAVSSAESL